MGNGSLPVDKLNNWLDSSTRDIKLEWPQYWNAEGMGTVKDTLDFLSEEEVSDVLWKEGIIKIRTMADKSTDAWLTYRSDLFIAFRLLGKFGGNGTLNVVGFWDGPDEGIRIESFPDGASRCTVLTKKEVEEVRAGVDFNEVEAIAEKIYGVD